MPTSGNFHNKGKYTCSLNHEKGKCRSHSTVLIRPVFVRHKKGKQAELEMNVKTLESRAITDYMVIKGQMHHKQVPGKVIFVWPCLRIPHIFSLSLHRSILPATEWNLANHGIFQVFPSQPSGNLSLTITHPALCLKKKR